jgi:proteasome activator subunit 4
LNIDSSVQVIDAVSGACSQICIHLSDSLYDMVLNMIFDYASNNVRLNAVRAIHQLVECVANANPEKTLAKVLLFLREEHQDGTREWCELAPDHDNIFRSAAF